MRVRAVATLLLLALPVTGCAGGRSAEGSTTVTVLAAASLTDAFTKMERAYEHSHPGIDLEFSFAGSPEVVSQVRQGAPASVVATADQETMAELSEHVNRRTVFARGTLVIVTAPGNPKHIDRLADLARDDVTLVLAAPEVPAGNYAREVLSDAGVRVRPSSEEQDVRAVLSRVRLGEADAGIVYASDAQVARDEVGVVPIRYQPSIRYPAAVVTDGPHPVAARTFVTWLDSERAQKILGNYGFARP